MPRKKKIQVSEDGWSTVTSGPSPRPPGVDPLNTLNTPHLGGGDGMATSSKTYERAYREYRQIRSTLVMSENYKKVISFAEFVLLPNLVKSSTYKEPHIVAVEKDGMTIEDIAMVTPTRGKIDKCICLALGSLSGDIDNTSSMYQLALLKGLLDLFGWRNTGVFSW